MTTSPDRDRLSDHEIRTGGVTARAIIEVEKVSKHFGGVEAVANCSLVVGRGSITGLIGPNGAGKTTLFDILAGTLAPESGTIRFDGEDVTGLKPHQLFARGLLRTFQIAHEFSNMTALENLMMVPAAQPGESLLDAWLRPRRVAEAEVGVRAKALAVVDFLHLGRVKNELAGNLSGGQK
ncbi:MAG: ATP-binding cassette domain-containing protein, partial [Cucumibacter sp.]